MAVTIFGATHDSLCGKIVGANAVASAGLVGSLKRLLLTVTSARTVKLATDCYRPKADTIATLASTYV